MARRLVKVQYHDLVGEYLLKAKNLQVTVVILVDPLVHLQKKRVKTRTSRAK